MESAERKQAINTAAVSDIEEALSQCGVTGSTLGVAEKEALDKMGYVMLPNVWDASSTERLREALETAIRQEQQTDSAPQTGTRQVAKLASRNAVFDGIYTNPRLLAAAYHVLARAFKVFQLSGRDPLPGYGLQGLHNDWYARMPSDPYYLVTTISLLDDFTASNGATRVIPGSHLWPKQLPKAMTQPLSNHPDQRVVIGKAGSVLIFNGHLYHGGTRNDSKLPRRVITCQFVARNAVRPGDNPEEAPEHLTPAARYLLGA